MNSPRRLAIAFDSPRARDGLLSRLSCEGMEVDCFDDGQTLVHHCQMHAMELVVLALSGGVDSPARDWPSLGETPLCALAESEEDLLHALKIGMLLGLVVGPISCQLLKATIQIALRQVDRVTRLEDDLAKANKTIDERKIIERAKGLLMQRARIDEAEAYNRMRRAAREARSPLTEIARSILVAEGDEGRLSQP
jgi:AmiR/NasT family two-component response regulator